MFKRTILLFLIICESLLHATPLKPYIFNNDYYHLSNYYQFIEDCSGYSRQQIIQKFQAGEFKAQTPNRAFSSGLSSCSYWLTVNVLNKTDQKQKFLWNFYNNGLSFELYELSGNDLIFKSKSSMHNAINNRPFAVRSVSFPFYLNSNQSTTLFVKVTPTVAKNVYFPTDITTPEDYLLYEVEFSYLMGKYFGILLFALFVNICLFLIIRERIYLYTVFYVFFIILFQLSDFHFDSLQIPVGIFKIWSFINKDLYVGFSIFFYAKIFQIFIDLEKHFPVLNRYFNYLNFILFLFTFLVLMLTFLYFPNSVGNQILYFTINFIVYVIIGSIFLISIYGIWQCKKYFLQFGISFIFLFYGFLSYLLNGLNSFHFPIFNPGNIINGSVIEVSLLTIFFVYKFKLEKEEAARKIISETKKNLELSTKMLTIESEEQERLARNIHDEIGSDIAGIRLQLENHFIETNSTNEKQELILKNVKILYEKTRNISHFMNSNEVHENFVTTIENQIGFYQKSVKNIEFDFYTNLNKNYIITSEKQLQIIRIVKEIYTNALKHAMATKISMQIILENEFLQLIIEDNGIGFNTKTNFKSMGLNNINSRVGFLKGTITIESNSKGTSTIIMIPTK